MTPLRFPTARILPPTDPIEHAMRDIHEAASTFLMAIHDAETIPRLIALKHWLSGLSVELAAIEDVAGEKLNQIGERT